MRNETHVEFNETIRAIIIRYNADALGIRLKYETFVSALTAEISVLDIIRKSELTVEINTQNMVRISSYRGLSDAVKSVLNHYDEEKRKASRKIEIIFQRYGNIGTKTLDEATAAIEDLLRELRTDVNFAALNTLGLTDWLNILHQENSKFTDLMLLRYKEAAQRPTLRMVDARKETDKAHHDMIEQIEALVRVNGMAPYDNFIKEINAVNERYKNIMARQAGERKP
jgi:hypothetical protein